MGNLKQYSFYCGQRCCLLYYWLCNRRHSGNWAKIEVLTWSCLRTLFLFKPIWEEKYQPMQSMIPFLTRFVFICLQHKKKQKCFWFAFWFRANLGMHSKFSSNLKNFRSHGFWVLLWFREVLESMQKLFWKPSNQYWKLMLFWNFSESFLMLTECYCCTSNWLRYE